MDVHDVVVVVEMMIQVLVLLVQLLLENDHGCDGGDDGGDVHLSHLFFLFAMIDVHILIDVVVMLVQPVLELQHEAPRALNELLDARTRYSERRPAGRVVKLRTGHNPLLTSR